MILLKRCGSEIESRESKQNSRIRLGVGIASAVISAIGLSIAMPAMSAEASHASEASPTRLQKLRMGAQRAQLERLQRSQVSIESLRRGEVGLSFSAGDGVYLYGEQPAYNRPATAYFVFKRSAERIQGAFYTPSSSFDCAQGRINSDRIQLTITDSYSQESYSYALGLRPVDTRIASDQTVHLSQRLEGYHALPVRMSDRAILATCL